MMRNLSHPSRRTRTSCSVLALATVLVVGATPASAQSFLGSGSFATNGGGVASIGTSPNTTTISVNPGQTVINWSPTDTAIGGGSIVFQNSGTTANFLGTGNYAVLNRINPVDSSRSVTLNGTIQTLALGAVAAANGSLYFYTPGGFVIGGSAVINVGSFVLSASPITLDVSGNFITGANNQVIFGQATRPGASIITTAGSQINAAASDAYVAMVAPRVEHRGNINVNGSAALVGAEAATINFSPDGLFDIQVTTGTTNANGVYVSGDITGSASSGATDARRAFLVAVPKNTALTMAIISGSDLGFAIAGAANVSGNAVILSAGHDIVGGEIGNVSAAAGAVANMNVNALHATSGVRGAATGYAEIFSNAGQSSNFASDLDLRAQDHVWVNANGAGATMTIGRDLTMISDRVGVGQGGSATGGFAALYASGGGVVTVTRDATLSANGTGANSSTVGTNAGNGTGGNAWVQAEPGGSMSIGRNLSVTADGTGGQAFVAGVDGGAGTGGTSYVRVFGSNAALSIGGTTYASANGTGGASNGGECFSCGNGGKGTGGTALVYASSATNSSLTLNGPLTVKATGFGGSVSGGLGGDGQGGDAELFYGGGTTVSVTGDVSLNADGRGGSSGTGNGAAGTGGTTRIGAESGATSGGSMTITGNASQLARGFGGDTSASGAFGGTGTGGTIDSGGNAGTMTVTGSFFGSVLGFGGYSGSGTGGSGYGGDIWLDAFGASITVGSVDLEAQGAGGDNGSHGGYAEGGYAALLSSSSLTVLGDTLVRANATGGFGNSGDGGDALGGNAYIRATNGTLAINGNTLVRAQGFGGGTSSSLETAGDGHGGNATVRAMVGGTINLGGTLDARASGFGGDNGSGVSGGNGHGGDVRVQATEANANITVGGATTLVAQGWGAGGNNGTGGTVWVEAYGAPTASLAFQSNLALNTAGIGGDSTGGLAGTGQGGEAQLRSTAGSHISVSGDAILNSNAFGGYSYDFTDGSGGNAVGGTAQIETYNTGGVGGNITIDGSAYVYARGFGGDAPLGSNTTGGDGTGGSARIITTLGTITIGNGATVSADGFGGYAPGGTGGDGFGGPIAAILAINGNLNIGGFASVSGSGFGGNGMTGGNGFGSDFGAEFQTLGDGAQIFARNGNIVIDGGASVSATGVGGGGGYNNGYGGDYGGDGGNGSGGLARILAQNGDAGPSSITIVSGNQEGSGTATVYLDGTGGNGGNGASGATGGNGGKGGTGTGGYGGIFAAAGNGTVTIDNAYGYSRGTGGSGGNGGNVYGGAGGNGGNGGAGVGGSINIGTISGGNDQALGFNDGVANYGSVNADASAFGGGGGGGTGGTTNGNGGDGGDAIGGNAVLLVRGSTVNVDSATLTANATGGNAGFGGSVPDIGTPGLTGIGGDATVGGNGGIGVVVTDRYLIPAQRGTLNAGTISGTAIATSGIGIPNGLSRNLGGSGVFFRNADGNIGSLDFLIGVGSNPSAAGNDSISVIDGDVTVKGEFRFVTPGNLSLFANNGDMHTGILTLDAGNFVFDPDNDPPSDRGTYFADSATITTGNNFVTSANLDIGGNLSIIAPGLINAQKFTIDGDLELWAQGGGITATILDVARRADLDAAGSILINSALAGFFHAQAGGSFTSGNITSDTDIQIQSVGNMTLGNLIAGLNVDPGTSKAIRLDSDGSILMGNAIAKDGIDFSAGGSLTGGNLTSGLSVGGNAEGAISLGAISSGLVNSQGFPGDQQGFSVGMSSATSITTGNVAGAYSVGFATLGPITTGTINAGADFLVMASGNMLFGPITATGRVYLADSSMFIAAGGGGDGEDNFNPELVFAANPIASQGSITLQGPVNAGKFVAAAGTTLTGTTITSGSSIYAFSGANMTLTNLGAGTSIFERSNAAISENNLNAGSFIDIRSIGGISLGNLVAGNYIDLRSNGAIGLLKAASGETINFQTDGTLTGLAITAGNSVLGRAIGAIQLGAITAGITNQSSAAGAIYRVGLASNGNITTGAINALGNIDFATPLALTTGNLTSAGGIMALVSGNMSFGSLTTGNSGYVYLGSNSMAPLGGAFETFNRAPILALFPASTGGSITIGGPVTTGNFRASAGTTFNAGNVTSTTDILIDSGGNMTLGNLIAGTSLYGGPFEAIRFNSGGSITLGNATAKDGIDFDAAGSVAGGNLTSGRSITGSADGAITFGVLSGGIVNPQGQSEDGFSVGMSSGTSITVGDVAGAESVGFASLGSVTTGNVRASLDFLTLAGTNMSFGTIDAGGRVYLANASMFTAAGGNTGGNNDNFDPELVFAATPVASGGSITAGTISARSVQAAAGTALNVGAIQASGLVGLSSGGAMQVQNITAGSSLRLTSGGTINGGNLVAGTLIRVSGAGAVNVGNITINHPLGSSAEDIGATASVSVGSPVEVFGASIATGNIATDGYVGLYTPGSLTVGTIDAGHDVIALVGTNAAFGAIHTTERFLLGGYAMFASLNGGETFTPALAFGATKAKTNGSATFGGSSSVGSFQAYVGTDTTLQSLQTASSALIDTGGLFSLDGTLNGNSRVISNDIAIGTGGAVNTGNLQLVSRNATQTVVGDGVAGGGYQLSDAEFDRIHTPLSVVADTSYGAAAKMLIGDLTAAVSGTSQSGYDYEFATINGSSTTSVGSIKVVGNATFNGLSLTDEVAFKTNLLELDAATGSINLFGQGTALGGILGLYAPKIWVASGAILTKLEANPTYSGYIAELNAPATVQRPEGVLRAASIDIGSETENTQSLLIQNTGTKDVPAGFLVTDSDIGNDGGSGPPAGSIGLVINGQIVTAQGTLTGLAVRDLLVTALGTTQFVSGSTINGCPLTGSCASAPPTINTVVPTDLQLVDNGGLGDGLFGNEPDIAGEDGGDLSSPITPPIPLFDSRPLDQSGDIDDPVSGAGNPSLYGNPDEGDGGDDSDEQKKKKSKKGDGK